LTGSGNPWYQADIVTKGNSIAAIGVLDAPAKLIINAIGRTAAPGFIDIHTHACGILAAITAARGRPVNFETAAETAIEIEQTGGCQAVYHAISEDDVERVHSQEASSRRI
jgi:adenine deaminase